MLLRPTLLTLAALLAFSAGVVHAGDAKKVRVVIIDGQNNHDWKSTTPVMHKALLDCGRFTVDVATSPQIPSLPKPNPPAKPKDPNDEKAIAKYEDALAKYKRALVIWE